MHKHIQGVGWYARKSPNPTPMIHFYRDALGLQGLRGRFFDDGRESSQMFYTGETATMWVSPGGYTPPAYTDRDQAPLVPILRVYNLDELVAKTEAAGCRIINRIGTTGGKVVYFVDPSGNVTGFQQRDSDTDRAEDQEAMAAYKPGVPQIPGMKALPEGIQSLGWVVHRLQDVPKATAWYKNVLGLETVRDIPATGGAMMVIGEGCLLETAPGGGVQSTVADRKQALDTMMLRVHGITEMVADLKAKGVHFVNDLFDGSGFLAYLEGPEGQVIGLQERKPDSPRAEDQEADRRWAARG